MKPKPEESIPRAYIRPEFLTGRLPDDNPYGFKKVNLPDKNTKEYKAASRMVNDFLSRFNKATPLAGSRIAF